LERIFSLIHARTLYVTTILFDMTTVTKSLILIDPFGLAVLVLNDALWEPESNFMFGGLDGIRAVADVASGHKAEVSTDGAWSRGKRVGSTEHDTTSLDSVETFDNESDDWTGSHIPDKTREEWLAAKIGIVLLEMFLCSVDHLQGYDLEPTFLESLEDLANQIALNAVWLDHDEAAFCSWHFGV